MEEAVDAWGQLSSLSTGSVKSTYNALRVLVLTIKSEQSAAIFTTHLPHAADHTSGNKYVFHGCGQKLAAALSRLGKGREKTELTAAKGKLYLGRASF